MKCALLTFKQKVEIVCERQVKGKNRKNIINGRQSRWDWEQGKPILMEMRDKRGEVISLTTNTRISTLYLALGMSVSIIDFCEF